MPIVVILLLAAALVGVSGARAFGHSLRRGVTRAVPGLWRPGVGVLAMAVLIVALAAAVRSEWGLAAGALLAFGVLALTTRYRRPAPTPRQAVGTLSRFEAAELLGIDVAASPAEVRAAHARLIRVTHPDRGGSAGLAARINAARDRLLA